MSSKAGANARARTRATRATTKRHVNKREREAASQEPPPQRGRHARLIADAGERSDGARRAVPRGDIERRGGRDRGERKGGSPLAGTRGSPRHPHPRAPSGA
jgi:hypothetical protein